MLVCTVLPTFNERANIGPLITRLLDASPADYMVLVVDDDSPDRTWEAAQQMAGEHNGVGYNGAGATRVAVIRRLGESGLTSAIQRGIDEAIQTYGAGIVTWMDCDLSMPPEDVPRLVEAIRQDGADIAVGSRWAPGGADVAHGVMARTLSWIINRFAILLLGGQVRDYTSGFIAARAGVLQEMRLRGNYGEYCIDLLGRASHQGYRLQEVAYVCVPRTEGDSKTGANLWDYLRKGYPYFGAIIRLAWERRALASPAQARA